MFSIETDNLLLRPWEESDAEALYKYASDPEVGPRAGWAPHQNVEESLEVLRTLFIGETMWAIVLKGTSEPIGCIGYLPQGVSNVPTGDNEVEIGYWIARPFWNRGICTEALQWLVDYCFIKLRFNALWGDFFVDNPASGHVMEKCGFQCTGQETTCPNLYGGADRKVRVMKIENDKAGGLS